MGRVKCSCHVISIARKQFLETVSTKMVVFNSKDTEIVKNRSFLSLMELLVFWPCESLELEE